MLGTERVTISKVASELQKCGYIQYARGRVNVTNRQGLEDLTCACYQIVKTEYDRQHESR